MQQHYAVVIEQGVTFAKEGGIEADADMLEHTHRNDAIEFPWHVAIVLQAELDLVAQALFGRPSSCDSELSLR